MKLRQYQEEISSQACQLLQQYGIAYLSMQVRTGKTITSLTAAQKFNAKHVLFVTKKKAISSIESDYTALLQDDNISFSITVVNFEQVHNVTHSFDLAIIDEAHSLGQFPTPAERTKLLKKLCHAKPIIYLSGTPTPESFSQLYHQFYISSFSPFSQYSTFYKFAGDYVNVTKKYISGNQFNDYSKANEEKVKEATKHLFISYSQEEAGFNVPVTEKFITIKMKPGTYALIEKLRKDRVYITREKQELLGDTEIKLMQKLHQMYSGTVKFENNTAQVFDSSKVEYIEQNFTGQKIAIFYKFVAEYAMIVGKFGYNKLTSDPMEFRDSDDLIFVSQIQSGREGINLSTADCIIMLNIDFSAVSYFQAIARLQTKDRTKPALIYWLFAENGIESKVYKMVSNKKDYTLGYFKKDYERTRDTNEDHQASGTERMAGTQSHEIFKTRLARLRSV